MSELRLARCKTCGAPILWATIATPDGSRGRTVPLDATPERRFVFLSDDVVKLKETYQTHFATCPQAAQHRRSA